MATEPANMLTDVADRHAFRSWLELHHADEPECWVAVKRGRPTDDEAFWCLDAVEEALCFGWIDSTHREIAGVRMQRFGPRKPKSPSAVLANMFGFRIIAAANLRPVVFRQHDRLHYA